jgi:malonyl-CoA O-methyltransferase
VSSKTFFAGVFSRHAVAYRDRHEVIRRQGQSRGRARLVELLDVRSGERVLDLCCGPGNLGAEILERAPDARVLALDLAPGMLALVRVPAVLADAESLPLADRSVDAVACGHGLQFCSDLDAVLREVRRVLRPGGRLAASVPHLGRSSDRAAEILDRLLPPFPDLPDRSETLRTVRDVSLLETSALAAGFATAQAMEVGGEVVWASPREMFEQAFGWWSCAVRLEGLDPTRRRSILEEAVATFEAERGDGPVVIPGSDLVLYASA